MVVKNPQTGNRTLDETLNEIVGLIMGLKKLGFKIEKISFDEKTGNYSIFFQHLKAAEKMKEKDQRPEFEKYSALHYNPDKNLYIIKLTKDLSNDNRNLVIPYMKEVGLIIDYRGSYASVIIHSSATFNENEKERIIDLITNFYRIEINEFLEESHKSNLRSHETSDRQEVNSLTKSSYRLYPSYDVRLV